MDLVDRVKGILLDPKTEWRVIAGEQTSPGDPISRNYVAILAAIPAVCGFIGTSIIAPCQSLSPGGNQTMSPGRTSSAAG